MQVFVETQNIAMNSDEKVNIRHHAHAIFSRIGEMVHSVKITLADANGPKGGVDKECTVVVKGITPVPVVVKDKQTTGTMAVSRALQRANFAFLRKVKRGKTARRHVKLVHTSEEFVKDPEE